MGAEVLVQSTPLRALTGVDGTFEISVPGAGTYTLTVVAAGYASAELAVDPASTGAEPLRIFLDPLLFDVPGPQGLVVVIHRLFHSDAPYMSF
jgi:hypothetical protein